MNEKESAWPDEVSFEDPFEIDTLRHLAKAIGWPVVMPEAHSISCGTLRRIPLPLATAGRCVPLVFNQRRVVVVVDDPVNGVVLIANPQLFGPPYRRRLQIALTTPRVLDVLLDKRRRLRR